MNEDQIFLGRISYKNLESDTYCFNLNKESHIQKVQKDSTGTSNTQKFNRLYYLSDKLNNKIYLVNLRVAIKNF